MTFAGPQNESRVRKAVDALDLIHASAKSNKVGPDEEQAMLMPIIDKLASMGWHMKTSLHDGARQVRSPGTVQPAWDTVRTMSQQAELKDLLYAVAVFLNRVDTELHRNPKGN
jgi:hypothetical protein